MRTHKRAEAIAEAAAEFSNLLGPTSAEDLMGWVGAELGHPGALDTFVPHGGAKARALAAGTILHVVSGNTPHAALQSLIGGLLLGSRNLVKLPRGGLAAVEQFLRALPGDLRALVEVAEELPDAWWSAADAVVAYGSDETITALHSRTPAGTTFVGHGHKISFGVVWNDPDLRSCAAAARDVSRFDQQGCLSPHMFYVRETCTGHVRAYAEKLAAAMDSFNSEHPRGPLTTAERAEIADLRAAYRFRAAGDLRVALWEGGGDMDWTVIYEEDPWFAASCLHRVVFIKPLPADLGAAVGPSAGRVGAIGLWPCTDELADRFIHLRPSRFCPLGRMQDPPWTWHNGGVARLASLVKWVDFEA